MTRLNFILAGQSNIAGRGVLSGLPDFPHRERIRAYGYSGLWGPGIEPLGHADGGDAAPMFADPKAGAGPGIAFASRLAELVPKAEMGLIPAAKGGSRMDLWRPRLFGPCLYRGLIVRARAASAEGGLAGMIWYQGESDCVSMDLVLGWPSKFRRLVRNVRRDLRQPRLPVIMTILGPDRAPSRFPFWGAFVAMQRGMALPEAVARVSAHDLEGIPGDPHLTTGDCVRLGRRYADAMTRLMAREEIPFK